MLCAFGAAPRRDGTAWRLTGRRPVDRDGAGRTGRSVLAAFLLVAAAARDGGAIRVRDVGVNPTRTGLLDVLERMGAEVRRERLRLEAGEPVADLIVEGGGYGAFRSGRT